MNFRLSGVLSSYGMRLVAAITVLVCLAATVAPGLAQVDNSEEMVNQDIGRARIDMAQGEFDSALSYADRAVSTAPDNRDALKVYAEIASIWQPRYNKEKRDKSLAKLQGDKPELVVIGDALEARQPDKAIEAIRKAMSDKANANRKGLYCWLLAQAYGRKGETSKYAQYLEEAIGWERGNFLQARFDLLTFHLSQKRIQEAGNIFGMLQNEGKGGQRLILIYGYLLLNGGNADGAVNFLQAQLATWRTKYPNTPKDIVSAGYNLLGQAYYNRSNNPTADDAKADEEKTDEEKAKAADAKAKADEEKAIEALENAYEIDSLHTRSLLMLAGLSNKKGDFKKALEYCDKVVKRDPDDKNVQRVYGTIYMLQAKPDLARATAAFKAIVDDDGKETNASLLGQGHAAFLAGQPKAAYEKYAAVIKRITDEGEDAPASLEMVSAYASLASDNKKQAVEHLDKIFDNEENSLYTAEEYIQSMGITAAADYQMFMRAMILTQENWLDEAEKAWQALLKDYPKCLPAAQSLMRLYVAKKDDLPKAEKIAERIEKEIAPGLSKDIPIVPFTRASIISAKLNHAEETADKRQYRDQLIKLYTGVKKDYPDRPEAWRALIGLYINRGNDDTAKQLCEEGMRKFPTDNVIFRYYANVLGRLDETDTLNKAYEDFIVKTEETGESTLGLLYNLARLYHSQNKFDLAIARLKAVRETIQQESAGDAEKLAQMRKTYLSAYELLRYLAGRQSDSELELKINELIEEIDPDSSGIDYYKGFRAFLLGDLKVAIAHFDAEIARGRLNIYHLDAIAGKGMAAFQSGDTKTAIATFDLADNIADHLQEMARATANEQTYGNAKRLRDWIRFYKACAHLAEGNINFARSNLLRCRIIFPAKDLNPGDNVQNAKTRAFDGIKDLRKVLGELSADKNDKFYHLAAGMFYAMRGYYPKAESEFDIEIKANQKNFIAFYLKGMALFLARSAQTRPQAIEAFEAALALQPNFVAAQYQIMAALVEDHKEKKTDESQKAVLDAFEALIKLDPRFNEDLAKFYENEKEYAEAIKQYLRCTRDTDYISGNRYHYLNQAAWLAAEHLDDKDMLIEAVKNAQEALKLVEVDLTTAPASKLPQLKGLKGSVLDTLARAQYKLATVTSGATRKENLDAAKKNLNEAIELLEELSNKQTLPTVFSHLGDVLLLEGDKKGALEQYKKADDFTRFAAKKHVQEQIEQLTKELE